MRRFRNQGSRERVEPELPVEVASRTGMKLVEAGDRAHHPGRINDFGKCFEFPGERAIAQGRLFDAGGEFEQIVEQAVEDADLFFEGRFAVFGQRGGFRE